MRPLRVGERAAITILDVEDVGDQHFGGDCPAVVIVSPPLDAEKNATVPDEKDGAIYLEGGPGWLDRKNSIVIVEKLKRKRKTFSIYREVLVGESTSD